MVGIWGNEPEERRNLSIHFQLLFSVSHIKKKKFEKCFYTCHRSCFCDDTSLQNLSSWIWAWLPGSFCWAEVGIEGSQI